MSSHAPDQHLVLVKDHQFRALAARSRETTRTARFRNRAPAVVEVARQHGEPRGLVRIEHQLEELVVAAEQGDTAANIRLVSDARQQGEAFGRLGRMPAQHPPDADAMPNPGETVKHSVRVRSGEVNEADVAGGDA
jgi:hypothetical protein